MKIALSDKKVNFVDLPSFKYDEIVNRIESLADNINMKKTDKDRQRAKRFKLKVTNFEGIVIKRLMNNTNKPFVKLEEIFDIVHEIHLKKGHTGRDAMVKHLAGEYANITRSQVEIYLKVCEFFFLKNNKQRKGLVTNPLLFKEYNSRCQVDLIDMQSQPDGEYRFILNYQDHLTKFVRLVPLKHKSASDVALFSAIWGVMSEMI